MSDRFHLKGLDGLRAIAAIAVVIGHIELMKNESSIQNLLQVVKNWGSLGVNLFFVLSGFLITTLLLKEKRTKNTISLKNFYIRRILRIWPLYFLILLVSALIFNYTPSWLTLILCSTIFPNIAHSLSIGWAVSPQIWSIGVEEQFYLFWPTILKFNPQKVFFICLIFILFYPFLPHFLQFYLIRIDAESETILLVEKIFEVLKFNAMATGALFSLLYFNQNQLLFKILKFSKIIKKIIVVIPFLIWFIGIDLSFFQTPVYSIFFGLVIIFIVEGTFVKFFEIKPLKFLGKISYGIYMYHWIILILFLELFSPYFKESYLLINLLLYLLVMGITIITSYISFIYFERPILRYKERFN